MSLSLSLLKVSNQILACIQPHITAVIGNSDLVQTLSSSANIVCRILEIHVTISENYMSQSANIVLRILEIHVTISEKYILQDTRNRVQPQQTNCCNVIVEQLSVSDLAPTLSWSANLINRESLGTKHFFLSQRSTFL